MEALRLACERLRLTCPSETMVQMFLACSSFRTRDELITLVESTVGLDANALHPDEAEDLWQYAKEFRSEETKK